MVVISSRQRSPVALAKVSCLKSSDRCPSSRLSPLDWYLVSYRGSSGVMWRMTPSLLEARLSLPGSLPDKYRNDMSRGANLESQLPLSVLPSYHYFFQTSHNSPKCLFCPQEPDTFHTEHLHVMFPKDYRCHRDSEHCTIRLTQASKKPGFILQQGQMIRLSRRTACLLCRCICY